MTTADWAILVPAVVGVLGALAAYLKARTATKAVAAHLEEHK
jgi:cation transporter-like permease